MNEGKYVRDFQYISPQMGYRVFLQTHKAEPYSQASVRMFSECCENALVDSYLYIPPACQNQCYV